MDIYIKTVPNEEIKKRMGFTGADWWTDENGEVQVRVASELNDWRQEFILAMHETAEIGMCKYLGITQEQVDDFDKHFQQTHDMDLFAGDEPDAPYKIPHTFATAIERILAGVMNVDWNPYDDNLGKL